VEASPEPTVTAFEVQTAIPVGPFVADFCCYEIRVVELDGEVHAEAQPAARDRERDAHIRGLGVTILRFPNGRIFGDTETVLLEVLAFAQKKTWLW
jgi:very-short-patch-repair endonuclease